jgi:hypothetical protein
MWYDKRQAAKKSFLENVDWRCDRNNPGAYHYKPFCHLSDLLYKLTHGHLAPTL